MPELQSLVFSRPHERPLAWQPSLQKLQIITMHQWLRAARISPRTISHLRLARA
jgi:hypothetical protein